jgi:hypothetical protein
MTDGALGPWLNWMGGMAKEGDRDGAMVMFPGTGAVWKRVVLECPDQFFSVGCVCTFSPQATPPPDQKSQHKPTGTGLGSLGAFLASGIIFNLQLQRFQRCQLPRFCSLRGLQLQLFYALQTNWFKAVLLPPDHLRLVQHSIRSTDNRLLKLYRTRLVMPPSRR